ncbi:MAG TPA: HlyD family efflux transporter periplasmic adaptor subunit [Anaerolineaceae bacterium]|jgi:multidrug resistance efflux pump
MKSRLIIISLILVLSVPFLGSCSGTTLALGAPAVTPTVPVVAAASEVMAEGHIAPRDSAQLGFLVGGRVDQVLVKEGDQVKKGALLARIGDRQPYEAAVASAKLELLSAQQALDTLNENGDVARAAAQVTLAKAQKALDDAKKTRDDKLYQRASQETIDIARANLILADKALEDAETIYNRNKNRDSNDVVFAAALSQLASAQQRYDQSKYNLDYVSGLPDPLDLQTVQANLDMAQAALNDAKRQWTKVQDDGINTEQLALAQSRKTNADAQVAAAQAALDNLDLVAPYDGLVTGVNISADEHVVPAQPVITLADFSSWYVETSDLAETDVVKIKTGQTAWVTLDSLPGVKMEGVVDHIADGSTEKGGDVVYKIKVRLLQPDERLRWGMTTNVSFPL